MTREQRRWLRRGLTALGVVIVGAGTALVTVGPGLVESSMNKLEPGLQPKVSPQAKALHQRLHVVDLHADTLMWDRDLLERAARGHVDLPRLRDGHVALQVFSSVSKSPRGQNYESNTDDTDNITLLTMVQLQPPRTWGSLLQRSLYHAEKLDQAVKDSGGALILIRTKADVDRLVAAREAGEDVTGALFSVEGLQNLEGRFDNLAALDAAGMRMAGFTHFFDNELAGSMHGVDKGGLTDLGRQTFDAMEQRGIVVDLAHASHTAIEEMLQRATRPLVASHGGVQATCNVNRNLTDDEIRGIARTGGIVGVGYWDAAICELTPKAVVDAIEHVIAVGGIETAALGSDYDGAVTVAWDTSNLAVITQELLDRGRSEAEIAAIMGGNTLRVLRAVLPTDPSQAFPH